MAVITLNPATTFQTIHRWEKTAQGGQIEFIAAYPTWKTDVIAAAVEAGINALRVDLWSGIIENSTDYYGAFLALNQDAVNGTTPTEWGNTMSNRRIPVNDNGNPNSINPSGFKWPWLDQTVNELVDPLKTAVEATGETFFWSVCYVHFSTSNQLHVDTPAEYGELMLAVWQHCDSVYGYVPDGLEIFLEPDNGDAQVTGAELAAMINAAVDRLTAAGFAKPYIIAPSVTVMSNAEGLLDDIETASATALARIDEYSYHRYGTPPTTGELNSLRNRAIADGKNTAMTEWAEGADQDTIFEDLTEAGVSAWQQYALAYPLEGNDDGSKFFYIDGSDNIVISDRGKYLRQYFKFIRRNAQRIEATASGTGSSNTHPTAFINQNGTYVVVINCDASVSLDIAGLPAGTYNIKYTTASNYDVDLSPQTIGEGGTVSGVSMPAAGTITIYDENYLSGPPAVPLTRRGGFFALI